MHLQAFSHTYLPGHHLLAVDAVAQRMVEGLQPGREDNDPSYHQKQDHSRPRGRAGAILASPTVTTTIVQMPSEQLEASILLLNASGSPPSPIAQGRVR